jgi:hypothetical protein
LDCVKGWGKSTEHDRLPADRCLLIATGVHIEWRCAAENREALALAPQGLSTALAGSHPQVAISRQPVVFS